jgi:hypothetical protein
MSTIRTYNHGDMLLPLLQEVLQELSSAAHGQILKSVSNPVPQLQNIQLVLQPAQMDHFSVAESAEGSINQICQERRTGQ